MTSETIRLGMCSFELLRDGETFRGLGRIDIGATQVRSGRLPLTVFTQTFSGLELSRLRLLGVEKRSGAVRIRLQALFRHLPVKLMRDHSIDPIHDTGDWDVETAAGAARIDLVLAPARARYGGHAFAGFAYHWEYESSDVPVFYLLDRASWELDGDVAGATVYSQSSCSAPVVTFGADTFWTTEGELFFLDPASHFNRIMTHNLPRWAGHQAFDFQVKGGRTLIGIFDHVDLIRTVLRREPGKPELKCFDKHIFDEAKRYCTVPKAILSSAQPATEVQSQNLWTWIFDEVHARARAEFGLKEQPPIPMVGHHHWTNFTIDTYYKDIVPACEAVGIRAIFAENFKKSDASEVIRLPNGNMCCSQEYEIAERLGGMQKFKEYIARCHRAGIRNYLWTNTYVSLAAGINPDHRAEGDKCWYMAMEDTRTKLAGAYTCVSSNLDFKNPAARRYWVDAHRAIVRESGLDGYFVDSFYNLFFMPVDYKTGHPRTHWREALGVMKELQDAGAGWYIESFGPFGQPQHGHPSSYNPDCIFACYYVGLGDDYVTVPVPGVQTDRNFKHDAAYVYYQLAHKVPCRLPVFIDGKRIDQVYGPAHRRALREYHERLPRMSRRWLQEDGRAVVWHDRGGKQATVFSFVDQRAALPGSVTDLTVGVKLLRSSRYRLRAGHTYVVGGAAQLPVSLR